MRTLPLLIVVAACAALWAALPTGTDAQTGQRLEERLGTARERLDRNRRSGEVLTTEIDAYSRKIGRLASRIVRTSAARSRLETELDRRRRELLATQSRLRAERARPARLRVRLRETRRVLARRLLETYKADKPDVLTVVLNSDGFAALLERGEFIRRIAEQDRRIVELVGAAKRDANLAATRLDRLERRQQQITSAVLARRNEVALVERRLTDARAGYARARAQKARALRSVRVDRRQLVREVRGIERAQAAVRAKLARAARAQPAAPAPPSGPVRRGSGDLIWPVNGPLTSPFGPRWGRLHAGIDISAPDGTPIRAADAGRVVIAGWEGGYGNYTCIQHSAEMSTCYAHQSRLGTSVGASVRQGEVMGFVGNTGNSFGAHLHFEVRMGGSPVDPAGYL